MFKLVFCITVLFVVSGCADSVSLQSAIEMNKVGFWYGVWHGVCFPFSFFGSLFVDDISIYAIYNNGGWYDFGFWFGVCILGVGANRS
jgi:hypothetical protein